MKSGSGGKRCHMWKIRIRGSKLIRMTVGKPPVLFLTSEIIHKVQRYYCHQCNCKETSMIMCLLSILMEFQSGNRQR